MGDSAVYHDGLSNVAFLGKDFVVESTYAIVQSHKTKTNRRGISLSRCKSFNMKFSVSNQLSNLNFAS